MIKAFRANFGISQMDLAAVCRITQANLSAIENDRREVGADVALRLSEAFGVAPEIILYPQGYEKLPQFLEIEKRAELLLKLDR